MSQDRDQLALKHFVEEIALLFEGELPRMYGRVVGHLLVCDPPQQSSAELADALQASRGAISQATRALMQIHLVSRVPRPGTRAMYFELRPDGLDQMLHAAVVRLRIGRELGDRGLALMKGRSEESRSRLRAFRDVYAFMEREYPKMLARWDQSRKESE
ncbi:MAG: MarR family transcriptional regulator [Alphaproteobacteria bacterium]|nr:MarR family transcriptional regulator [Alphaproteobacteria bacterium]